MNEQEKYSINYRFSGYQLPKIQLDSTGPSYYVVAPHPYYSNQPLYWRKPYWTGLFPRTSPIVENEDDDYGNNSTQLYRQLPLS